MNKKAFIYSFEALLSLTILINFLLLISTPINVSFNSIYLLQKQHDLLKVWSYSKTFNANELIEDFKFVFPQNNGKIVLNNSILWNAFNDEKNSITSTANIFSEGQFYVIELTVFFN